MDNPAHWKITNAFTHLHHDAFEEMNEIESTFITVHLNRNDYFLKEGQICTRVGFLNSGKIRHYYNTRNHEVTRWMSLPNDFTTSLRSFISGLPSIENLQAIEDCELVVFDKKASDVLIKSNELFKTFWIKAMEYNYVTIEDRVFSLIEKSAEERFEWLIKSQLRFLQQVPVMYVASMLGITTRHLSRMRKKFKV